MICSSGVNPTGQTASSVLPLHPNISAIQLFPEMSLTAARISVSTEGDPQERTEAEGESENKPVLRSTSVSFPYFTAQGWVVL